MSHAPIQGDVHPVPVLLTQVPLSVIHLPVGPLVNARALYFVIHPLAGVDAAIGPDVGAIAVLLACSVGTLVGGAILPGFFSLTVLQVVSPVTFILAAVHIVISSESICFVKLPLTIENVTICMVERASPMRTVVLPLALVACAVRPHLCALTVALRTKPRPVINGAIRVLILTIFNHAFAAGRSARTAAPFILTLSSSRGDLLNDDQLVVWY